MLNANELWGSQDRAPTRVAIVDDYPIIREGLRNLIYQEPDIELVAEGQSGQEALHIANMVNPDIILLDINLPDGNGLEITHRLKGKYKHIAVLLFTAYDDDEQALHALRAGARGYCAKGIQPFSLLDGIRQVAHGRYVVRDSVYTEHEIEAWFERTADKLRGPHAVDFAEPFLPLSQREMEILQDVVLGMSNKEIAADLLISHQTVKNHISSILDKMNVEDRTQAAMRAIQRGWIRIATNETQPHNILHQP